MKSTIFWDITPCSLLNINRRFGGKYRLHLQGYRISRARNQRESRAKPVESQPTFRGTYRHHLQGQTISRVQLNLPPAFTLVSSSAYSSVLKIKAICSSETSVDFQRNTRCYFPEDGTLQGWCYFNVQNETHYTKFLVVIPILTSQCILHCTSAYLQEALITVSTTWRFGEICQTLNFGIIYSLVTLFSILSLFWKNKVGLWCHTVVRVYVCVCLCIPPINFRTPEPIFMKLGTYITTPEPISTAYLKNSLPSVCVSVCVSLYRC
jgi:hypothetical protein